MCWKKEEEEEEEGEGEEWGERIICWHYWCGIMMSEVAMRRYIGMEFRRK